MLQLSWLANYRTIVAAWGSICSGAGLIFQGFAGDVIDGEKVAQGSGLVSVGLGMLGIRFAK